MVLGDKLIQPSSPNSPQDYGSSMASSEVSDEDGELSLKVMLPSGEYRESCSVTPEPKNIYRVY